MFSALARENTLNKSIQSFHTQETYHLILKLYFDISDEIIIIIVIIIKRKQLVIIILCLEMVRRYFFYLFIIQFISLYILRWFS